MLIHGVGGGTCQWAAQMAKLKGYKVIGTCAKGKEAVGRATNVDELILIDEAPGQSFEDYTSVDVVKKVMDITGGEGVKAVIDGIGKNTVDISIDSLARRGIFVSFGNASGAVPPFPVLRLIGKSAFVTRPKLLDYPVDRKELLMRSNEIFGWLGSGEASGGGCGGTYPASPREAREWPAERYSCAGVCRARRDISKPRYESAVIPHHPLRRPHYRQRRRRGRVGRRARRG